MFSGINKTIRNSIYGVLCQSELQGQKVIFGNGTAFMIAPGICVTAAHVLHFDSDKAKPLHQRIEVIRAPEIGGKMIGATLIAENPERDIALIKIHDLADRSMICLSENKIDIGTNCGSLGFPLANIIEINKQWGFNLVERFQGAFISAFQKISYNGKDTFDFYETDALMYGGSSGCPGFTKDGIVFGMHVATVTDGKENTHTNRLAIALWVPSMDIIEFAKKNGITQLMVK